MKTRPNTKSSGSLRALRVAAFAALALSHVSCLPTLSGLDVNLAGQQVRFTLLQTSDIHSRLLPYDFNPLKTDVDLGLIPEAGPFGGATRMASLVKRERAKSDRVLHLDDGDSFQGAPIFNLNLGEVEYKFLSMMGVDAAVIGNHEFDAGAANFTKQARDQARFPVLAANYLWEDMTTAAGNNATGLYTSPYTIKNVGGVRVGIIGLANISSMNSLIERGNSVQAVPLEQNETARDYVELLRPSVDLVLITSHAGLTEDQELVEGYEAYYEWRVAKRFVERKNWAWEVLEWFGPEKKDDSVVRVHIPGVEGIDAIMGGHLHIVLNPPQLLTDPAGRKVILSHGGAFSKYVNRLDFVLQMPKDASEAAEGAEIISHDFRVFPIDGLWCSEALHQYYTSQFWGPGQFVADPKVKAGMAECTQKEDLATTQMLLPYITDLDIRLNLTSMFGYAPRDIARRNNSTGGDSPLGNIAADSMRRRKGVEAELAVTNSLGIRDNLYAGPLTQEAMFNVFPFENTINIMFLSGRELQEMFDFIADRSAGRGCAAQSQISGARFTMDCAQTQLNDLKLDCDPKNGATDCPGDDRSSRAPWQCIADETLSTGGRCWAHTGTNITINEAPLDENVTYRVAVNDYIARGGSGFLVLKRNTSRIETGIPLRDSLIGYMQNFCNCDDILAGKTDAAGNLVNPQGIACGNRDPQNQGHWIVDDLEKAFCKDAKAFHDQLVEVRSGCTCADVFRRDEQACSAGGLIDDQVRQCVALLSAGPALGRCSCRDALAGDPLCGNVTRIVRNFCENPTGMPVAIGTEDGRIVRRVK
jgi:2',3'-cyclic-nucleotide 2'-phosphodiesterase (5'-nucleotidase family)